ncbi:MAG TPA: GDSL-type esterase/lipase family protein [Flavitalea sp.]|nr:GDSL-type esterase/lipase family protein [Flavitalea sp.]
MKTIVFIMSVAVMLTGFTFQQKKLVIFFGDSITEAGVKPGGYINVFGEQLKQKGMDNGYELQGAGIGGNKVYDLYLRLEDDVMAKKPDVVVIWVGVNDVWHKSMYGTGTDPDKFEKFYTAIIKKLQGIHAQVVLCTPAAIGEKTDYTNSQDGDLNQYAQIIRGIAQKNNCKLVDLRKILLDYNLANNNDNQPSGILTSDGVHLNEKGNALVAEEMLKVLTSK